MRNLYCYLDFDQHVLSASGIAFDEFYCCGKEYFNNILLLKSEYVGLHCYKNFELLLGKKEIEKFAETEDLRFGDLCFADFHNLSDLDALTDFQIAELLYVAHMKRLLQTRFFPALQNHFIYLSHDNAAFLKLFFNQCQEIVDVLCNVLRNTFQKCCKNRVLPIPEATANKIADLMGKGVLWERSCIENSSQGLHLKFHVIGSIADMDYLASNEIAVIKNSLATGKLIYANQEWKIV